MSSLATELDETVQATSVVVTDETISVDLVDGRSLSVPTEWYPRLVQATVKERANYEIDEVGIRWPGVEADCSIRGLLLGRKSGESPASFKFWLDARRRGKKVTVERFLKARMKSKK